MNKPLIIGLHYPVRTPAPQTPNSRYRDSILAITVASALQGGGLMDERKAYGLGLRDF